MTHRLGLLFALLALLALGACGGGGTVDDLLGNGPDLPADPTPEPPADPPVDPPDEPPADPPANGTSMSDAELAKALEVHDRVNAERALEGLPALVWDDDVAEVATQHSIDMDVRDYFSHTNPDGALPWDRLTAAGVPYSSAGENIYWASWSATAAQAVEAWMNSPGHRDNILRTGWTHTGIGVHEGSGGSWWTQVFISR